MELYTEMLLTYLLFFVNININIRHAFLKLKVKINRIY